MKSEFESDELSVKLLKGPEDVEEWKGTLLAFLEAHGLRHHATENLSIPQDKAVRHFWARQRQTVVKVICESVHPELKASLPILQAAEEAIGEATGAARNHEEEGDNVPKQLFEGIQHAMASRAECDSTGATALLVERFCALSRADEGSIAAYQARAQMLRRRLIELGAPPHERFAIWVVINGLKKTHRIWHKHLVRTHAEGRLTWDDLMREMSTKALKEHSVTPSSSPGPAGLASDSTQSP